MKSHDVEHGVQAQTDPAGYADGLNKGSRIAEYDKLGNQAEDFANQVDAEKPTMSLKDATKEVQKLFPERNQIRKKIAEMTIRLFFGVVLLISATSVPSPLALSQAADPGRIDNTHGAPPLIIRDHHTLALQNRTEKSVQSCRLGCFRSATSLLNGVPSRRSRYSSLLNSSRAHCALRP
jgi:hypothetical protein